MELSYVLHYKNKYPGGRVDSSATSLDVFDKDGNHVVALRRDGAGGLVDQSAVLGCMHSHDLAPIPKDARLFKLVEGKIARDDKADERQKGLADFCKDGRVLSCHELGMDHFDDKQKMVNAAESRAAFRKMNGIEKAEVSGEPIEAPKQD